MSIRGIAYAVTYVSQVWRVFRWLNRGKVKILMYHGVTDQPVLTWTQVPVSAFARQMRYLHDHYSPVSLEEAVGMLNGARPLKPHAVAVTFDDGFRNNLTAALPILQRYRIPATIFVTTSFIEGSPRYAGFIWTDYIFALLDATPCQEIDLTDLGLGRHGLGTEAQRSEAKEQICRRLKQVEYQEKDRLIEGLRARLGGQIRPSIREVLAPMTWEDIGQLQAEPLIRFGAHTENHEILSRVPEPVMVQEIVGSHAVLERRLGSPVTHFAYPNGAPEDFTDRTTQVAGQHFACALTTVPGQNVPGADLYTLKRLPIGRDTGIIEFKLSLSGVTDFLYAVKRAVVPRRATS